MNDSAERASRALGAKRLSSVLLDHAQADFAITLRTWAGAKTPANREAHVAARDALTAAVQTDQAAAKELAAAREAIIVAQVTYDEARFEASRFAGSVWARGASGPSVLDEGNGRPDVYS